MIILYTTNCPRCKMLEMRLKMAKIEYKAINDINLMEQKGIVSAPCLEIDGMLKNYSDSMAWIMEAQNEKQ